LRLLILVAREGFLKDKYGPRAKKFEHHWRKECLVTTSKQVATSTSKINIRLY